MSSLTLTAEDVDERLDQLDGALTQQIRQLEEEDDAIKREVAYIWAAIAKLTHDAAMADARLSELEDGE